MTLKKKHFLFFLNVFNNKFQSLCHINFVNVNLDKPKILSFATESTLYQTTVFLDLSKLKALADNKINVTQNLNLIIGGKTVYEQ